VNTRFLLAEGIRNLTRTPLWAYSRIAKQRAAVRKGASRFAQWARFAIKRAIDILVSGLVLLCAAPFFGLIALLIKLEDGGPIFYWQERVGRHGVIFPFPKFRSMVVNAEEILKKIAAQNQHGGNGVTFKMKHDPRVTRVGRTLRRFSLDELPQLWCVLRGHMSLVGPRPALPREVARYTIADRRRLDTIPGLTCIWQVSGRSNLPFPIQCKLDAEYIDSQSVATDLKLLAKTVPAVITGKGAY
jgi:lipopolysaccharide/colanic/teichoic acid biosynthesis glycosyltransferase